VLRVLGMQVGAYEIFKLFRYLLTVLKGKDFYAIRFSGGLHGTGEQIQLLFLGLNDLLIEAFFNGSPQREVLGAFHPLLAGKAIKEFSDNDTDIVVAPHFPWSARGKGELIVPESLEAKVQLPDTMGKYLASLKKEPRRRIRRALEDGYQFEPGTSKEDYAFFHEKMHVPLVTQRHGDRAYIIPFAQLYATAHRSSLVFVKQNGKRIAGFHVCFPRANPYLYFNKMGILPEVLMDKRRMRSLNTAMYFRMHEIAIENKYSGMDLGATPPVLGNGILFFKSQWGASFYPTCDHLQNAIQFLCSKEKRKRILERQRPLIHLDQGKLVSTVRIDEERMTSGDPVDTLQRMWFKNLARIDLMYPNGRVESLKNTVYD
jgi:hypothetical protein